MMHASWAEVISYSINKIHQTWYTDFISDLFITGLKFWVSVWPI